MSYAECSDGVIAGLFRLVSAAQSACPLGFDENDELSPRVPADISLADVDCLIAALSVLRPEATEPLVFGALSLMLKRQWDEAIQALYQVVAERENFHYAKALLAFCLCHKGDAGWRPFAVEVLENDVPDSCSAMLIQALDAYVSVRDGTPQLIPSAGGRVANSGDSSASDSATGTTERASVEAAAIGTLRA